MIESIERMRKLVNDNLVMGLRFQMNGELNKLEQEIEQELNSRAERTCRNKAIDVNKVTPAEFRTDNLICSACGETVFADSEGINYPIDWQYCPNCGAKVIGG